MSEAVEIPVVVYHIGYKNPVISAGWYDVYVVQDGTAASPGTFDSLVQFISEHLSRPENTNKKALVHNKTPNAFDAFKPEQVARIELLLSEHNRQLSGLAQEVTVGK